MGEDKTAGDIIEQIIRLVIVGPLIGLCWGWVISTWIRRMEIDPVLEVNISLFGSYLLFYTCEYTSLHASGILALVTMGIYMQTKSVSHRQSANQ